VTDDGKTVRMTFAEYREYVASLSSAFRGEAPVKFCWDGPREVYVGDERVALTS
jgi:hypothetical protein